jgi:UDP-N-acetylmuramoyl-L-alanyl-D-glutamate--2,6-diaminopimelate ligase
VSVPSFGVVNADDPSAAYFAQATSKPVYSFSLSGRPATLSVLGIESFADGNAYNIVGSGEGGRQRRLAVEPERYVTAAAAPLSPTAGNMGTDTGAGTDTAGRPLSLSKGRGTDTGVEAVYSVRDNLPGAFNAVNVMASCLAVMGLTGVGMDVLVPLIPRLTPVRGRMSAVNMGQDFEVIIDYAHTPSSFSVIFPPLRARIDKHGGRLIVLFGSGGERDTQKRPEQGKVAAQWADFIILTDEDPRGEAPMDILRQIAAGVPATVAGRRWREGGEGATLFLIPDRFQAIDKAFSLAKAGDVVLLLGKGHENSIIYADHTMPYDEFAAAEQALARRRQREV